MLTILGQLFVLYVFLLLGWGFGKKKPILGEQTGLLSFLLVNLLMPAKVFGTFAKNFTVSYITENYFSILVSTALLVVLCAVSLPLAGCLSRDAHGKNVYRYSLTISNYAYLGYVLMEDVFGSQALTDMILFCIPFALYTYTFGYALLTGGGKSFKKLFNPITAAILLGIVVGLVQLPVPQVVSSILSSASACVGPLSMLLTGITLAAFSPKELVRGRAVYVFVALRLVAIPLVVYGVFKLAGLESLLPAALLMACMPCVLNTIVFPK